MSGRRAYPTYPQAQPVQPQPPSQHGQPGYYSGMPQPSTNQPPPHSSSNYQLPGPLPSGVTATHGAPGGYYHQHSHPGALRSAPPPQPSSTSGVTSQLGQLSLGPQANMAGNLDIPSQQHSRTPSPHLQGGDPAAVGGIPTNLYPRGPSQPPPVTGPGNFGNPPPAGLSTFHSHQMGSGSDQHPTGFGAGQQHGPRHHNVPLNGPPPTGFGIASGPSQIASSTVPQTKSGLISYPTGPGIAPGPHHTGPYPSAPPHTGSGMAAGPPTGFGLAAGLATSPPLVVSSLASAPTTTVSGLVAGPPPPGSGVAVGPPPLGSGLAAGSSHTGSVLAAGPPPTGSGLAAGPPPTGSGLAAGPPPTGSGLAARPPPTGSGLSAGPPPTGSGLAAGPPPTGSGLTTGPPQSGPLSRYQYSSSSLPPPPPTVSFAQPSSLPSQAPPPSSFSSSYQNTTGQYSVPPSSEPAGQPHGTMVPPIAQQMHGGSHPGQLQQGHVGLQQAHPGQRLPGGQGPTPSHQQSYAQATAGPNMHQAPEVLPVNLLENRTILPPQPLVHPTPMLPGHLRERGPDPAIFCCTMNNVPATNSLLSKTKLPLAIHIHPFKDVRMKNCPVINPSVIVRCRICRSYINPFVTFVDTKHWRCNMCFRTNAVPDDYDYNPVTGRRGDRSHHNELKFSSVEYIAPSEYMVRPPQPSVYFFVIDVSLPAIESGVLAAFCRTLLENLSKLPGDGRTMVGFLTFDSSLHFYNLKSNLPQPQMLVVSDIEDVFIPCLGSLLVNLRESKELIKTLLEDLPRIFANNCTQRCALGPALQVAEKLLHQIGGRISVVLSSLPNSGPGALKIKEHSAVSTKQDQLNMSPSTDFYKKMALECSAQQITVDVFIVTSRFVDVNTVATVSKFSSGQVYYYNNFNRSRPTDEELFAKDLKRYLTRNIGFEAVMRIRCTEGLSLHTFHGNFFVRSTDLLSLPNVNPDLGYCMNIAIDESLKDYSMICFQAALLYTSYRGERRIRVHTLCLPVVTQAVQIYAGLNVQAIAGVLSKMAVDRAASDTLGDARDALMNSVLDSTKAYRSLMASSMQSSQFCLPASLCLLPLFVLSLLKSQAFSLNGGVTLDLRAHAMNLMKTLPLDYLIVYIYPRLYSLHSLSEKEVQDLGDGKEVVVAPLMHLSAEKLSRYGVYLMDYGTGMCVWVSKDASHDVIQQLFGVKHYGAIPGLMTSLPEVEDSDLSHIARALITQVRISRQYFLPFLVVREDGPHRLMFVNRLTEDKTEDGTTYYEFLSHVSRQINK